MPDKPRDPRVLIVTPEVTYLPEGMGNMANSMVAKAGGLADVSAALVAALFEHGADVHVALPDYRSMFASHLAPLVRKELSIIRRHVPDNRIHLAEDRVFFYQNRPYSDAWQENIKIALAFQREVINHIVPQVQPDLIHCNDWMTGLIPAMSRWIGVPCLFTIHNIHTVRATMAEIEDRGIDAAAFWQGLYFESPPGNYWEARERVPVDFLTSGVFGAHYVNTVSPTFLTEMAGGRHSFVSGPLRRELANKLNAGCAVGILNSPDPSYDPQTDKALARQYGPKDHEVGKRHNKRYLQKSLGLERNDNAPVFVWPSRLDPIQKGCQLLADILYRLVDHYRDDGIQFVFVANGAYQQHFYDIKERHNLHHRIAVCNFDENLSRLALGAGDFVLVPSRFEPCGLPQMIGSIYGALPVVHDTGGLHDTVWHLDAEAGTGNGFVFKNYDTGGLWWGISEAMRFYLTDPRAREAQRARVMEESARRFNHNVTAQQYIDLYETMLERPLIKSIT
jgi:starch synthase/alpha-amylase